MIKLLIRLLLMSLILFPASARAYCLGTIKHLVEMNDLIFLGVAEQQMTFPQGQTSLKASEQFYQLTTFRIVEILKGDPLKNVEVWTCPTCMEGVGYQTGDQKLVGASIFDGKLVSTFCSLQEHSIDDVKAAILARLNSKELP